MIFPQWPCVKRFEGLLSQQLVYAQNERNATSSGRDVMEYLENEKLCKPSVTSAELQQKTFVRRDCSSC